MVARERRPKPARHHQHRRGRVELLHYLREQAISRATHRYGDVL
ncbi:MAG: hypothetical protein OXH67_13545 [Acidimicrobiaceae bacterium]|nr:hypothetical protein [Acidimicrobiaceae bacterium]